MILLKASCIVAIIFGVAPRLIPHLTPYFACINTQAFNIMDQNRDGFIDMDDLKGLYCSLGE